MNALTQLKYLPENRDEQKTFVPIAIEELVNGDYSIMKFWVQATIIADTLNEIKDSKVIKRLAIEEAAKYKDQEFHGCKITLSARTTFDFASSGHPFYAELKKKETELKAQLKDIETLLKAIKEPIADPISGAIINPPTFTQTDVITIR